MFVQPFLVGIIKEIDPLQPREHYLLTTFPSISSLQPPTINPIRARAIQGGMEILVATHNAA